MQSRSWTILISLMGLYLTPPGMIADDTTTHANRWDTYSRVRISTSVGGKWFSEYFRVQSKSLENESVNAIDSRLASSL